MITAHQEAKMKKKEKQGGIQVYDIKKKANRDYIAISIISDLVVLVTLTGLIFGFVKLITMLW